MMAARRPIDAAGATVLAVGGVRIQRHALAWWPAAPNTRQARGQAGAVPDLGAAAGADASGASLVRSELAVRKSRVPPSSTPPLTLPDMVARYR